METEMKLSWMDGIYLAGIFDQSGSVYIRSKLKRGRQIYVLELSIASRSEAVLLNLRSAAGGIGTVTVANGRQARWVIQQGSAWELLVAIDEFTRVKKRQIDIAFRFLGTIGGAGIRLRKNVHEIRDECRHELVELNS